MENRHLTYRVIKNIKSLFIASLIFSVPGFSFSQIVDWKVKEDYSVKMSGKGVVFKGLKATISFDETQPEKSKIKAVIDATTLKADNDEVTRQAKETLETNKYPSITFVSLAIVKTSMGYEATGNLTLKNVTKQIKFPFKFDSKKNSEQFPFVFKETFSGAITVVPAEFNVSTFKPGEQVTIELTIPVTK